MESNTPEPDGQANSPAVVNYNIMDFFDMRRNLPNINLSCASTGYAYEGPPPEDPYPDNVVEERGQGYADEYQEAELREYMEHYTRNQMNGTINTLSQLDDLTSQTLAPEQIPGHGLSNVYEMFDFTKPHINNLSINSKRDDILKAINASQVTIIEGATGCGKSTQVPQFILDDCYERNGYCNIIVTQPRKIAAISIARRVCKERDWVLGELVGYQVGLDSKTNENTRLQYVTTGVLLQRLSNERTMNKYTHIILDEVHERDQDMDFTLLVVRKLLRTNSPFVKVILMSATFNSKKFSEYFSIPGGGTLVPCPILNVSSHTEYNVKIIYMDMVKNAEEVNVEFTEPGIDPMLYKTVSKYIQAFDELDTRDYKFQNQTKNIEPDPDAEVPIGSVLIFLPGIFEIDCIYDELHKQVRLFGIKWHILPLHSSITSEEQQCVFKSAPKGYRKIILSTNIAESSITVRDVKYVIDFCLTKEMVAADDSNFGVLQLVWASKANCNQRAGRVGRVSDGRVYRMVPQKMYNSYFRDECKPEMIRAPLSRLILLSKQLNMGSPRSVLAVAMDPPDIKNIMKTILHLKEIGGLLPSVNGRFDITDGDITFLGHVMASLPLDVHLSKMIFLGWMFNCLDVCVVMAASMNVKSMFSNSFYARMKSYNSKLVWSDGCMSDPIAFYNAYRVWIHSRQQNYFSRTANMESTWCERFCLQAKVMNEISALEIELKKRLRRLQIFSLNDPALKWLESEKKLLYKTVLAGAFYPNYFQRSSNTDEREALRILGGRDMYQTIYFTGMDPRQPGKLYAKSIKKALHECNKDLKVEFDSSTKVYVTFGNDRNTRSEFEQFENLKLNSSLPGRIPLSVYKAVKMRQLNMNIKIKVMKHDQSMRVAEEKGIGKMNCATWETNSAPRSLRSCLPGITVKYISCIISNYIDCGHFWVQPISMKSVIETIKEELNEDDGKKLKKFDNSYKPYAGQICAATYDGEFYRVRILDSGFVSGLQKFKVFFVDYGNSLILTAEGLRDFGDLTDYMMSQPMCAYEAVLAEVKPSEVRDAGANWSDEANAGFINLTDGCELHGMVYSVVNGVVACTMYLKSLNLNHWLIEKNYGQYCEENYQSKANYDARLSVDRLTRVQIESLNLAQEAPVMINGDVEPPLQVDCKFSLNLKGPYSPMEAHVLPLMAAVKDKRVNIDPHSVNSILMCPNPQHASQPLIVAAEIAQSQMNDVVTLRNTTVMPNIDGLPAIMAMLFCPRMKLFPNSNWTRYTKILCGLGYDEQEHPLYKEHDLVIDLNVIIDNDDIKKVNKIRGYMGHIMSLTPKVLDTPETLFNYLKCGQAIRKLFKDLWEKKRVIVNNEYSRDEVTSWKMTPEYKQKQMSMPYHLDEVTHLYTMHKALKLNPDIIPDARELLNFNESLVNMCRSGIQTTMHCRICEVDVQCVSEMRLHILTRIHTENVARLKSSSIN